MPFIKVEDFSGIVPRTGPTQLEANQAQLANNVKLQSRELRSWAKPLFAYELSIPNNKTIYRIDSPSGTKYWLEWATDVDIVPGPVADVNEFRYYYTGDGAPKKTNYALATTSGAGTQPYPNAWLYMGVPAPAAAPTLVASSTTAPTETRAYVYTYVSTFGTVTSLHRSRVSEDISLVSVPDWGGVVSSRKDRNKFSGVHEKQGFNSTTPPSP